MNSLSRVIQLCIYVLALSAHTALSRTTADIYNEAKQSLALILAYDPLGLPRSLGTGFFIQTNLLASNFHVVDGASSIKARLLANDETVTVSKVRGYSEALDLVILELPSPGTPLPLSTTTNERIGDKVIAIGNPRGLSGTVSEGIISGIRDNEGMTVLQITAPISPGSSGGPLLNTDGFVIGITAATLQDSQNLNFALPVGLLGKIPTDGTRWEPTFTTPIFRRETGSTGVRMANWDRSGVNPSFSLQNDTDRAIENVEYMLMFRKIASGDIVHYVHKTCADTIAPHMGKIQNLYIPEISGMLVGEAKPYPYVVEFRLLMYDFVSDEPGSRGNR